MGKENEEVYNEVHKAIQNQGHMSFKQESKPIDINITKLVTKKESHSALTPFQHESQREEKAEESNTKHEIVKIPSQDDKEAQVANLTARKEPDKTKELKSTKMIFDEEDKAKNVKSIENNNAPIHSTTRLPELSEKASDDEKMIERKQSKSKKSIKVASEESKTQSPLSQDSDADDQLEEYFKKHLNPKQDKLKSRLNSIEECEDDVNSVLSPPNKHKNEKFEFKQANKDLIPVAPKFKKNQSHQLTSLIIRTSEKVKLK